MKLPRVRKRAKRWRWLAGVINLNNFRRGAEVGVASGRTTAFVLGKCKRLSLLFAIDLWAFPPEGGDYPEMTSYGRSHNFDSDFNRFNKNVNPYSDRVQVIRDVSWLAAVNVPDGYLDFVFIDADHSYESVCKDIAAWKPKVRSGGMLCGHDTHFSGVRQALDEMLPGWREAGIDHVWWIEVRS